MKKNNHDLQVRRNVFSILMSLVQLRIAIEIRKNLANEKRNINFQLRVTRRRKKDKEGEKEDEKYRDLAARDKP